MAQAEIPAWFNNTVTEGLQILVTLSLPGQPPAETIGKTADIWNFALWTANVAWAEHLDRQRLRAGFLSLARSIDRWPQPVHVLQRLSAREPAKALPEPPMTKEQIAARRVQLRDLIDGLSARMTTPYRPELDDDGSG